LAFAQLGNVITLLQQSAGTTTLHDQPWVKDELLHSSRSLYSYII
jgi:hypothetical protein